MKACESRKVFICTALLILTIILTIPPPYSPNHTLLWIFHHLQFSFQSFIISSPISIPRIYSLRKYRDESVPRCTRKLLQSCFPRDHRQQCEVFQNPYEERSRSRLIEMRNSRPWQPLNYWNTNRKCIFKSRQRWKRCLILHHHMHLAIRNAFSSPLLMSKNVDRSSKKKKEAKFEDGAPSLVK